MAHDIRYPVGKFKPLSSISPTRRLGLIDAIAALPSELYAEVDGLTKTQLNTPYRDGGWTLRQVVHHLADSHLHAFVRMRTAVTEDNPPIRVYDQDAWAGLADGQGAPVDLSLSLINALHERWTWWLRRLDKSDFARTMRHPEHGEINLDLMLQLYAWHGRHHLGHIHHLTSHQGW